MARPVGQGIQTKKLISDKAKVLFEQKGYTATSMEDIRSFSQISKGSIYYHFKSKEELFLYTVEEASKEWRGKWEDQANNVSTAKEKLYLLGRFYASDMQSPLSKTVSEYIGSENLDNMMIENISQLIQPEYNVFLQIIEEGMRTKEFKTSKTAEDLAYILYSTLTGMSITQFLGYDEEKFYKLYNAAIEVLLYGIIER
ncbi:transcriptional regulator, TetR family [Gracilibacillus orientalis]|uniref:Transcriptional regulator, TetR family n=1 Tax=Gracilibacillus orientalis TaxID=334253 RepID=A0A1I4LKB2_9BACI|nr:TetR/AcrR family transcriptional regulator [Gracilibacillus orientalis]SFL91410.1 transcriptional regulator, TetR family [Gracilibacillus orientalis]